MPATSLNEGNPRGTVRGTPDPPRFDHTVHADNDRLEAFESWLDGFEAYCEAFYGHERTPRPEDPTTNNQWKRLLRIALALGTISVVRNKFPDLKDNSVTFAATVDLLKHQFGNLKSEYATLTALLDTEQRPGESFSSFYDRISGLAARSGFPCGQCRSYLTKHIALRGTSCASIRASVLQNKWSVEELPIRARDIEISTASLGGGRKIPTLKVDLEGDASQESTDVCRIGGPYSKSARRFRESRPSPNEHSGKPCAWCGRSQEHERSRCPASVPCNKCGKLGHFARVCRSTRHHDSGAQQVRSEHTVHQAQQDPSQEDDDAYYNVFQMDQNKTNLHPMAASITVGSSSLTAIVDTGAQVNVCPLGAINLHDKKAIRSYNMSIRPFGSALIRPIGIATLRTSWYGNATIADWLIVDDSQLDRPVDPIASKSIAIALGMISLDPRLVPYDNTFITRRKNKRDHLLYASDLPKVSNHSEPDEGEQREKWTNHERFKACFKGLGLLKGYVVRLYLKPNAKPFISPPRPHPYYLQPQIEEAGAQMLKDDVIEHHNGPAEWIANLAIVFKVDGAIRVTVDLMGLNSELRDTHIPIPTAESIKAKLANCKVFSKLDFKQAFHQLELAKESRSLPVFWCGARLYRYKRLSMGLKPASGELSAACNDAFGDLPNVHVIHDGVIVAAPTRTDHDEALASFLGRVADRGMTLNPDKCCFGAESIAFWGVRVGKHGVSPDPEKVEALACARTPRSKKELVSFLCMARANQEFIPAMASRTPALRALTHKSVHFKWEQHHEKEFESLRTAQMGSINLAYFDPNLATHVIVDAHVDGLCAILAQGEGPATGRAVAVASRATSPAEKRYPQLDLEAMAIDFGLRRFRHYLIGNPKVTVHTDHKPLIPIFQNSREGSVRVERIKLRHQDIVYTIHHLKGFTNPADFCSRSPIPWEKLPLNIKNEADEPELHGHTYRVRCPETGQICVRHAD